MVLCCYFSYLTGFTISEMIAILMDFLKNIFYHQNKDLKCGHLQILNLDHKNEMYTQTKYLALCSPALLPVYEWELAFEIDLKGKKEHLFPILWWRLVLNGCNTYPEHL